MANVWETFTDSYLKKLKRPELQGIFNPDQSYGANMLFRSEETNPWAGRDQSNAKFGPMGASSGVKAQAPTLNPQGARDLLPQGWNLPMMPSPQQDTFHQLMGGIQGPVANIGGRIGANAIMDWMKSSPQGDAAEAIMSARDSARMAQELSNPSYDAAAGVGPYGEAAEGMTEVAGGTTDVASGLSLTAPDPATTAAAAIPMLAKMFGLKGTGADALGAASSIGIAAAQGGMNPFSDLMAAYSIYKFGRGLFS